MSCSSSIFIVSTSHLERQPFRSSAVTTSTLECSASKCSLRASSPPGEDTTTALGTAGVRTVKREGVRGKDGEEREGVRGKDGEGRGGSGERMVKRERGSGVRMVKREGVRGKDGEERGGKDGEERGGQGKGR